jgi:outer membrane protein assembly factor BamB
MDPGPDGLLYVLDVKPQVTVIDPKDGRVARQWGRQGTGPGEFDLTVSSDNPGSGDISVARDGRVYVADGTNHRVQVFAPDGKFLFQFGSFGTGEGQFGAIENIETGPRGEVYTEDEHGLSRFTADGKFVWRSTETLHHFAVRADGGIVSNCEQCRQLLFVSPDTGRIVQHVDAPEIDGDGFGPINVDAKGDIYLEVYRSESLLVFDPDGKFIAGGYLQPGMRPAAVNRTVTYGDAFWPTPVLVPDGRAFTFAERGLVELKVTLPR